MARTLITNIGEFFTGDLADPVGDVTSLLVEGDRIAELNPAADTHADRTIDAKSNAVLPGIVDGHIHPVFSE